jgi:hypothetical protein
MAENNESKKPMLTMSLCFLAFAACFYAGLALGWVMAYYISGPECAERYLLGLHTYKFVGLKGVEFCYFLTGATIGMSVPAICLLVWGLKHNRAKKL